MIGIKIGAGPQHLELLHLWGTELVFEMHIVLLYIAEGSGRMHGLGFGCTRRNRVQVVLRCGGSSSQSLRAPSGKRKALKLNFANPPVKPATRLPLHPPAAPSFQNPHM